MVQCESMKKRVILFVVFVFFALGLGGSVVWYMHSEAAVKPIVVSQPVSTTATLSVEGIIEGVNKYRSSKGEASLVESPLLDRSACLKAQDMVKYNYWSHTSPSGVTAWHWFEQAGYSYSVAGKILHMGSSRAMTL